MNSGFCSMSLTAVTQLRAHFRTVSLKGQSQAGQKRGWRVEGECPSPQLLTELWPHPCTPTPRPGLALAPRGSS